MKAFTAIGFIAALAGCVAAPGREYHSPAVYSPSTYYSATPSNNDELREQFNNFVEDYRQDQFRRNFQDQYNGMIRQQNEMMDQYNSMVQQQNEFMRNVSDPIWMNMP
jgi:hypothetical protein